MTNTSTKPQPVTVNELPSIAAGKGNPPTQEATPPISQVKDPVYVTLAIGEGGGKLPDILS